MTEKCVHIVTFYLTVSETQRKCTSKNDQNEAEREIFTVCGNLRTAP